MRFTRYIAIELLLAVGLTAQTIKVPDGTALRLSLVETLSSATTEVDTPIHFELTENVRVAGNVLIPKGSTALGHVVEVEPRRRMGRAGKLNFTVDHVKAPDGSNLRLRASSARKGEDKTGTVIIGSVVLSPLFLIMRGKDVVIPKGTEISAYIDGDREIAGFEPAPASAASFPSAVSIRSKPDQADLIIDGKYVGSTPSVLQLSPGEHSILIEKAQFTPWKRIISVSAGTAVTVNADLKN
jgi:hypothetical protein